jgi:hypothetical protein
MASGMSLGPELPLVITGGMVGSMLGVMCRQSMLQARVMNLTAASGAIAGFFGFPMAGAMFVLEVPHRMGLQYFEALSPSTMSSILAVLVNRMIVKNDVTGYFNYPFLTTTLPSHIFTTAVIYEVLGSGLGVTYAECVVNVERFVHNLFHDHHHKKKERDDARADGGDETERSNGNEVVGIAHGEEAIPLVVHSKLKAHRTDSEDFYKLNYDVRRTVHYDQHQKSYSVRIPVCGSLYPPHFRLSLSRHKELFQHRHRLHLQYLTPLPQAK